MAQDVSRRSVGLRLGAAAAAVGMACVPILADGGDRSGVQSFGGKKKAGASSAPAASSGRSAGVKSFGGAPAPAPGPQQQQAPPAPPSVDDLFAQLLAALGTTPDSPDWNPAFDLNKNGVVDTADINVFLESLAKIHGPADPPEDVQLKKLQEALGSVVGDPLYDAALDMNDDGVINSVDLNLYMSKIGGSGVVVDLNGIATMGPSPTPDAPFITGLDANGQLIVIDAETEKGIIVPNGQGLWAPAAGDESDSLEPEVAVTLTPGGMDVVYLFKNDTSSPKKPGSMRLGGVRFGEDVGGRKITLDGAPIEMTHGDKAKWVTGAVYPNHLYSPVAILQENDYTVGVSFMYPIVEYEHAAYVQYESVGDPANGAGLNWQVRGLMNGGPKYDPAGDIEPGEERLYKMSVRVFKGDPDEWVRTLTPYRDFFQATYGGVQYARNPHPIRGLSIAGLWNVSDDNPYGFVGDADGRPDLVGWAPRAAALTALAQDEGWTRIVLVTPSGYFNESIDANYPSQMTSQWLEEPAMASTIGHLKGFGDAHGGFGLWWGHASHMMHAWNPSQSQIEVLNPDISTHRDFAFLQLDIARQAGVTVVGMDGFSIMPGWQAYGWLQELRERYPEMSFCTEAMCSDFLHTLSPTYVWAMRDEGSDAPKVTQPHMLADFLVPGHETWGRIGGPEIKAMHGLPSEKPIPQGIIMPYIEEVAAMGYVPHVFSNAEVFNAPPAAKSWEFTVPSDLQP